MESEAIYAEYYALLEALSFLDNHGRKNAVIFTDNLHYFSMFEKKDNNFLLKKPTNFIPETLKPMIDSIHAKLYEMSKIKKGRIVVKKLETNTKEDIFYHNIAHVESRKYMSEENKVYIENKEILFGEDNFSKKIMNKINLDSTINAVTETTTKRA